MRYWHSIANDFASDGHVHLPYIEERGACRTRGGRGRKTANTGPPSPHQPYFVQG